VTGSNLGFMQVTVIVFAWNNWGNLWSASVGLWVSEIH